MANSVLQKLYSKSYWTDVLSFFETRSFRQKEKLAYYKAIVESESFIEIADSVLAGHYVFKLPTRLVVNKLQTGKKKTVYLFDFQDDFLLKVTNRILTEEFSCLISPACHSFQKGKGAKTAFRMLMSDPDIDKKCCLKTDIRNFFNSINVNDFIELLPGEIKSDKILFSLICQLLLNEKVILPDGTRICELKGLMAGCPLSPFLSNIYLRELDKYFTDRKISYSRYSDDIIVFDYPDKIENHRITVENYLKNKNLLLNPDKTSITRAGEKAVFLGFSYYQGNIELSPVSVDKMKGKVRRLSRLYQRRIVRGKTSPDEALKHFITRLNRKLFGIDAFENDLCWAQWFFPVINSFKALETLDHFIQDHIRYSLTGRFYKLNFKKIPYASLAQSGYIPLKAAFFRFKKNYNEYLELTGHQLHK